MSIIFDYTYSLQPCSFLPEWLLNLSGRDAQSHAEYSIQYFIHEKQKEYIASDSFR